MIKKNKSFLPVVTTVTGVKYSDVLRDKFKESGQTFLSILSYRKKDTVQPRPKSRALLPDIVHTPRWASGYTIEDWFTLISKEVGGVIYSPIVLLWDKAPAVCITIDILNDAFVYYPILFTPKRTEALSWFVSRQQYELTYVLQRSGVDWIVVDGPSTQEGNLSEKELDYFHHAEMLAKEYAHRLGYRKNTVMLVCHSLSGRISVS